MKTEIKTEEKIEVKAEAPIVSGYYFYKLDKFIQRERDAIDKCKEFYGMPLDRVLQNEEAVFSSWGIDELSILLDKSVTELIDNKIVILSAKTTKDIDDDKKVVRNTFKKVTTKELTSIVESAIKQVKDDLKRKIYDKITDPMLLKKQAEKERDNAPTDTLHDKAKSDIRSIDSEITAYCEVISLLQ